jgi:hypothetical protein
MRNALFALPLLASALILPRATHADTITFSVSVIGSGSFGDTVFTDKRVTSRSEMWAFRAKHDSQNGKPKINPESVSHFSSPQTMTA